MNNYEYLTETDSPISRNEESRKLANGYVSYRKLVGFLIISSMLESFLGFYFRLSSMLSIGWVIFCITRSLTYFAAYENLRKGTFENQRTINAVMGIIALINFVMVIVLSGVLLDLTSRCWNKDCSNLSHISSLPILICLCAISWICDVGCATLAYFRAKRFTLAII